MPQPPIQSRDLIEDIRKGLSQEELLYKYDLSPSQLTSAVNKLINSEKIPKEEIERYSLFEKINTPQLIGSVAACEGIRRERKIFVIGILALTGLLIFLALVGVRESFVRGLGVICALYLVIRLSRFLKQAIWLTALYSLGIVIQIGYPIVAIALIIQSTNALRKAQQPPPVAQPLPRVIPRDG